MKKDEMSRNGAMKFMGKQQFNRQLRRLATRRNGWMSRSRAQDTAGDDINGQ
ncbi:MAG: hypothetical protein MUO63_07830 [Desulfobulbaceae bacterium]|nr:hypothetical protein [Desulfobulbaceae bacterium]